MKNNAELAELLSDRIKKLELGNRVPSLYDPIHYILDLGGKRLRPILTLLTYQLYKQDVESILNEALSVEVFHNFTLMHDDIMDKASLRRGQPTVHEKWGVNTAILSGDVMLVKAYDLMLGSPGSSISRILSKFNTCASEVCEGQQLDMIFESRDDVTIDEYLEMIRLKTAVLLGYSVELGAILGGASEEEQLMLRTFATEIGIGFQLMDDLLDVYADASKFGKQVGGDIIANKKTFLLLSALQRGNSKQVSELEQWIKKTEFYPDEKVQVVKSIYDEIGIKDLTIDLMQTYFDSGFEKLDQVKIPGENKAPLEAFTQFLMKRDK